MGLEVTIGGSGALFVGEDKKIRIEVLDRNGVPVDTSAMSLHLFIGKSVTASPLFDKTLTSVGTYNVDRTLNEQRSETTFTDTELNTLRAGTYQHATKRMDDGSETVITYGPFVIEKSVAP